MNKSNTLLVTTVAVIGIAFVLNLFSQEDGAVQSVAWEHLAFRVSHEKRIDDPELAKQINELGSDGWELVDVESRTQMGTTVLMIYFFKRPK